MDFFEYVKSFYGVGGLYNFNIPDEMIKKAIAVYYIGACEKFCGDSIDRENILNVLEVLMERSFA